MLIRRSYLHPGESISITDEASKWNNLHPGKIRRLVLNYSSAEYVFTAGSTYTLYNVSTMTNSRLVATRMLHLHLLPILHEVLIIYNIAELLIRRWTWITYALDVDY